jgi:hypothetical protein
VTVGKTTPAITTWPTASAITYGQTIASSILSGQVVVTAGAFAFTIPTTAPNAGTANQSVTFTPTDTVNYTNAVQNVIVTVNAAAAIITTWPSASAIIYGQTLASSTLSGAVVVTAGTFSFTTPATTPSVGTSNQSVTFTPTDTLNYFIATDSVTLTVNAVVKASPDITTWPSASAITYGQTLASSTLSGGFVVTAGTFSFTTPTTAPIAGSANQSVIFIPTDTVNYTTLFQNVSVTVNAVAPDITVWPSASAITYGQTLASSTLSGGVVITAGTFSFTTPATVPGAGTAKQSVIFTPIDTANYTSAAQNVSVTVNAAAPIVTTWPSASAITYGQTLVSSILSGGVGAGSFAFTTPTTAPNAGTANQSVTFTPSDLVNYTIAVQNVNVTVEKKILTITGLSGVNKTYDRTTTASLSGTAVLSGVEPSDKENVVLGGTTSVTFADSLIGTGKKLTVTGFTISGSAADDYTLSQPDAITASITLAPPATSPTITSIFPDTIRVGTNVKLQWDTIANVTRYRIQIGSSSIMASSVIDTTLSDLHSFFAQNLGCDSTYYFRVAGVNDGGTGPWSAVEHFTTVKFDTLVSKSITVTSMDSNTGILPKLTFTTGSDTSLRNSIITVLVKDEPVTDTASDQVTPIYDFSKSSPTQMRDSVLLTFAMPDTFIDGNVITSIDLPGVLVYEIDALGVQHAVYNTVVDKALRTVSFRTNNLGVITLAIDRKPPVIIDQTRRDMKSSGTVPIFAGKVTDNISNCKAFIYYRKGGNYSYDSVPASFDADGTFNTTLGGMTLDSNGFEYYVSAFDGVNRVKSELRDIPVKVSAVTDSTTLSSMQWRLFSTPINLLTNDIPVFVGNIGEYGKDWKLFQWAPTGVIDSLIEYGPNLNRLTTGFSYWIKSYKTPIYLNSDSGITTPINRCYETVIPARSWAALGNPYLFAVGWQSILDSSGSMASKLVGPYTYEDSAWISPLQIDKLLPWRGYYVYNSGDSAITLRIPSLRYLKITGVAKQSVAKYTATLEWIVSSVRGRDYRNYFGFMTNATPGYDPQYDFPKAGTPQSGCVTTWFVNSGFVKVAPRFQTDFSAQENGGAVWSVVVSSLVEDMTYRCEIAGAAALPDGLQCVLVDKHAGTLHDMRTGPYSFTAIEKEAFRDIELVVGNSDFVGRHTQGLHLPPQKLALSALVLHGIIIVKFDLPWSATPTPVKLDIFNLQGRLVTTLIKENKAHGSFKVTWDMSRQGGASGLYLIRLSAGRQHLVVKGIRRR